MISRSRSLSCGARQDPGFNSQEKVRTFVEKDGQKLLSNTAEGKIVLQEIKGVSHSGYYYSVTDKAPNSGECRYMTRGGDRCRKGIT
jgi:hypothetical protein